MHATRPKVLADGKLVQQRLVRVHSEPRVSALNAWVQDLRDDSSRAVPWFDPDSGGSESLVLFLLESPGPRADAGKGSGLISVDNDDPTAANLWTFRRDAGLIGTVAVHWNIVPWYLDGGKPTASDLKSGAAKLHEVLELLEQLTVVVPMGRDAQKGWLLCQQTLRGHLATIPTWHPGNLALNQHPGHRAAVQRALLGVRAYLDSGEQSPPKPLHPRRADVIRAAPTRAVKRASELGKRGLRRFGVAQGGSSA